MTLYFRLGDSRKLFFLITSFSLCLEKCGFFTWLNAGGIPQSQSKDVPVLSVLGQLVLLNNTISLGCPPS